MEKSNLNNLMKRIQKDRDEIAFSEIFDFFAPKINAYFIQNRIKIESSEELTQEVLSTLWLKSNLFDSKKSGLSPWIFTIARNKKIDFAGPNIPAAKSNISWFFTTVPFILKIPAFLLKYALFLI